MAILYPAFKSLELYFHCHFFDEFLMEHESGTAHISTKEYETNVGLWIWTLLCYFREHFQQKVCGTTCFGEKSYPHTQGSYSCRSFAQRKSIKWTASTVVFCTPWSDTSCWQECFKTFLSTARITPRNTKQHSIFCIFHVSRAGRVSYLKTLWYHKVLVQMPKNLVSKFTIQQFFRTSVLHEPLTGRL